MKKSFLVIFISLMFLLMSGCDNGSKRTLKVGIAQWPGYEPLALAAQMNMFDHRIKLLRFSSPGKAYSAFKSGAIDVVASTADELLKYADYGNPPKIFLVLDISHGADAIIAHKSIKDLHDIKGKTVALESSLLAQYMLIRALDQTSLTQKDIIIKNIEIVQQPEAFKRQEADVFVTFEPSKSLMMKQGGHVIFDSSMIPNEIIDALAADQRTWTEDQPAIASLIRGWYKALDYIKENPAKAYEMMGAIEGISTEAFEASLAGLTLGSKAINKDLIKDKKILPSLITLQRIMLEKKVLKNSINLNELVGE